MYTYIEIIYFPQLIEVKYSKKVITVSIIDIIWKVKINHSIFIAILNITSIDLPYCSWKISLLSYSSLFPFFILTFQQSPVSHIQFPQTKLEDHLSRGGNRKLSAGWRKDYQKLVQMRRRFIKSLPLPNSYPQKRFEKRK